MTTNNYWNSEQELYLKNIGEQSMAYTWMQEQTAMFYIKLDRYLGIFIIILSGAVGTNNFLDTNISTRQIIFGILGYLVTILGMFNQFLKPMEVSQQRINIGNKFQDIYYDIKQQLSKPKDQRKNADDYLESITHKFIELYDFAPPINSLIINRFKNIFKNSNITMPLNADFIDEIKIFIDEETKTKDIELQDISNNIIDKPLNLRMIHSKPQSNEFKNFLMSRLESIN